MTVQAQIEANLRAELAPALLEVLNESFMHNVPADSETHFKVTLVSEKFNALRRVRRHQLVYSLLTDLLEGPVHALALHLYTPAEWDEVSEAPASPNCHGGDKR